MEVTPIRTAQAMPWRVNSAKRRSLGWFWRVILFFGSGVVLIVGAAVVRAWSLRYEYSPLTPVVAPAELDPAANAKDAQRDLSRARKEFDKLTLILKRKIPTGTYIVIDQTNNRIFLKKQDETMYTAVCSAGGGVVLQEMVKGGRRWVFDTPQGMFKVLQKVENPIWKKPDWAFLEEGQPVPRNDNERFETGMLGEYALYFGNGYMIHGTLYERLLGRSVTHGCIRVGRDDLREVWKQCPIGTPIYIF